MFNYFLSLIICFLISNSKATTCEKAREENRVSTEIKETNLVKNYII